MKIDMSFLKSGVVNRVTNDTIFIYKFFNFQQPTFVIRFKSKTEFISVNLGTGKGMSVKEFIRTFEKINNVEIPFSFVERRPGDNAFVVADNSLAKSILRWEPSRNIEDVCRNGWNWQVLNPDGY